MVLQLIWRSDQSTASSLTVTAFSGDYNRTGCIRIELYRVRHHRGNYADTLHADLGPDLSVHVQYEIAHLPGLSFASHTWRISTVSNIECYSIRDYSVREHKQQLYFFRTLFTSIIIIVSVYLGPTRVCVRVKALRRLQTLGFSSYHWSTNETGNSITVTQDGDYAVTATTAQNCNAVGFDPCTLMVLSRLLMPVRHDHLWEWSYHLHATIL